MMLRWATTCLVCASLIAGCTSRGNSTLERLVPLAEEAIFGPDVPDEAVEAPKITRALLNQVPFATIAISTEDSGDAKSILVPLANNGGHLVYEDTLGGSFVIFGGLVTATHGLAKNLSAVKYGLDDPVAKPTPVSDWPDTVARNYQFARTNAKDYEISVVCVPRVAARERIEIFEILFTVVRIQETCTNPRRTFTNTYWVKEENGFIWKSEQWIGPEPGLVTVEIIRPFAG